MKMNNALGSPLEALAFNYLSLGFLTFVNNLWTLVAVVTAAVSFWTIRAAGTTATKSGRNPDVLPPPATEEKEEAPAADQPPPASVKRIAPVFRAAETTEATTSGKFTVYFEDDGEGAELPSSAGIVGGFGVAAVREDEWCGELKRSLRVRMGDMGWYRYQDLTAFDGNVVRLWDGCCSL